VNADSVTDKTAEPATTTNSHETDAHFTITQTT